MLHSPSQILNPFAPRAFGYGTGPGGSGSASAPPTPGNFTATAGDRAISLDWDAASGATEYDLYRYTSDNFGSSTLIQSGLSTTSAEDATPQPGELYYYYVVAKNASGSSAPAGPVTGRAYVTIANSTNTNLTTPAGSWMLTTLFFRTGGNLPFGCTVTFDGGSKVAASLGDGTWENQATFESPYDAAISGAFNFQNDSGGSVTIWNAEP